MKTQGRLLLTAMAAVAMAGIGPFGSTAVAQPPEGTKALTVSPQPPSIERPDIQDVVGLIDREPVVEAPGASASAKLKRRPYRWATHTARYYNGNRAIRRLVPLAARAWNRSGVRFRWKAVPRSRANVVIGKGRYEKIDGWASVAWGGRRGRIKIDPGLLGNQRIPRRVRQLVMTGIIAHEMGHIMGLEHESGRCATMNAKVWSGCRRPETWKEICRIVQPDDVRGVIRLFGGKMKNLGRMYCPIEPDPGPISPLAVQTGFVDAANRYAARVFTIVPPSARQGLYLVGAAGWAGFACPAQDFLDNGGQDGVFGQHGFGDVAGVPAVPGTFQYMNLTTGIPYAWPPPTVCFGMRLYGKYGRPGPISQAVATFPPHR